MNKILIGAGAFVAIILGVVWYAGNAVPEKQLDAMAKQMEEKNGAKMENGGVSSSFTGLAGDVDALTITWKNGTVLTFDSVSYEIGGGYFMGNLLTFGGGGQVSKYDSVGFEGAKLTATDGTSVTVGNMTVEDLDVEALGKFLTSLEAQVTSSISGAPATVEPANSVVFGDVLIEDVMLSAAGLNVGLEKVYYDEIAAIDDADLGRVPVKMNFSLERLTFPVAGLPDPSVHMLLTENNISELVLNFTAIADWNVKTGDMDMEIVYSLDDIASLGVNGVINLGDFDKYKQNYLALKKSFEENKDLPAMEAQAAQMAAIMDLYSKMDLTKAEIWITDEKLLDMTKGMIAAQTQQTPEVATTMIVDQIEQSKLSLAAYPQMMDLVTAFQTWIAEEGTYRVSMNPESPTNIGELIAAGQIGDINTIASKLAITAGVSP